MALGEKRNGSVFATAAQRRDAAEYQAASEPEIVPVVVDDTPQRTLSTDIGALGRAHNLFFTPSAEGRDFNSVLQEVQEYISGAYAASPGAARTPRNSSCATSPSTCRTGVSP